MKIESIKQYKDKFYKKYLIEENYECKNFLKDMQESEFQFDNITIDEDVERDMQSVAGSYSLEDVIENYDYYEKEAAREGRLTISAYGEYALEPLLIQLYPREKMVMFVTKDENLEISDVVKKNENRVDNSYYL